MLEALCRVLDESVIDVDHVRAASRSLNPRPRCRRTVREIRTIPTAIFDPGSVLYIDLLELLRCHPIRIFLHMVYRTHNPSPSSVTNAAFSRSYTTQDTDV